MHQNLGLTLAKRLIIAPAVGLLVLGGWQANTVDYSVQDFANVRIMNFAPLPAVNMDVYFWQDGQSRPALVQTNAQAKSLRYGGGAVYTTGIPAAQGGTLYHYVVCITTTSKIDAEGTMTLAAGKKYTLIITTTGGLAFTAHVIEDRIPPANADTSSTHVRFINMQLGSPKLSVRVNDATTGAVIDMVNGSHGVAFNNNSDYVALKTATDTSFAFFVTQTGNPATGVIARLTDQTFTPGNFYRSEE